MERVSFANVPSFAYKLDVPLKSSSFVPLLGRKHAPSPGNGRVG